MASYKNKDAYSEKFEFLNYFPIDNPLRNIYFYKYQDPNYPYKKCV